MKDKAWMLNVEAIRAAKECINLVKSELGAKLKMSDPDFLQLLHEYVELAESAELNNAYSLLLSYAGVGRVIHRLKGYAANQRESVGLTADAVAVTRNDVAQPSSVERVEFGGKSYPRWRDGKKFSGLFRGQPHYT